MSRLFPDHEFVQSITYGAQTVNEREVHSSVLTTRLNKNYSG